jgi:DNA-binding response OmpR family regulator
LNRTILVVEDNADVREMLLLYLTDEGFPVITAEDGQQALSLIERSPPDLIITDIHMPNLNGVELIRRLREQSSNVPIVVTSAFDSGRIEEAMKAGANRSAHKPTELGSLLITIKELLH